MFRYGVISLIWTEEFTIKDLPLIKKAKSLGFDTFDMNITHPERFPVLAVKDKLKETAMEVVVTTGLPKDSNLIDPDPMVRRHGVEMLKKLVDIGTELGSHILGGVIYATWGYITGKSRTNEEWKWSVESMREVAQYAKSKGELVLAVEPVQRFETHLLNIVEDAIRYCREIGLDNVKVHLDSFHMIREETSFTKAVELCGKEYLGYVHACENNRGIPGTGLVPWKEFMTALKKVGYNNPISIESFDPGFEELNRLSAIWRKMAKSGEELAVKGLKNLQKIERGIE